MEFVDCKKQKKRFPAELLFVDCRPGLKMLAATVKILPEKQQSS
jgi:hypothetical protein